MFERNVSMFKSRKKWSSILRENPFQINGKIHRTSHRMDYIIIEYINTNVDLIRARARARARENTAKNPRAAGRRPPWRRDAVGDETSRTMLVLLRSSATEKRPIIIRLALSYSISVAACYRLRSASLALALDLAPAFAVARSTAGRLVRGTIHNAI